MIKYNLIIFANNGEEKVDTGKTNSKCLPRIGDQIMINKYPGYFFEVERVIHITERDDIDIFARLIISPGSYHPDSNEFFETFGNLEIHDNVI